MKKLGWFILVLLAGCGGSLTSEERKEMNEARQKQEIKRVTEAELLEAGLQLGRKTAAQAGRLRGNPAKMDSLQRAGNLAVKWITPGQQDALQVEKQIIEAYLMDVNALAGDPPDNIQIIGDSLMYSKPVVHTRPDGAIEVQGMWSIVLPKKTVVLSITE